MRWFYYTFAESCGSQPRAAGRACAAALAAAAFDLRAQLLIYAWPSAIICYDKRCLLNERERETATAIGVQAPRARERALLNERGLLRDWKICSCTQPRRQKDERDDKRSDANNAYDQIYAISLRKQTWGRRGRR